MAAQNTCAKKVQIKINGTRILYICPKCKSSIIFKKKILGNSLCMKCGQRLDWTNAHDICSETIYAEDSDEAAWIAKQYYEATGFKEEEHIDIDNFRQTVKNGRIELFLLFLDTKSRGRFMRRYAKEGQIHDG